MSGPSSTAGESFEGFPHPKENYTRVPNDFFKLLPMFETKSEFAVVLYIIRHTWGFQEFEEGKRITTDEFINGRKRRDGTRMDDGTGLSAPSVRLGIEKAVAHGFLEVEVDETDKARIEKFYMLKMLDRKNLSIGAKSDGKKLSPDGKKLSSRGKAPFHRTEKETKEKNLRKKGMSSPASLTIVAAEDDEPAAPKPVQEKPQRHASITDETLAKWVVVREWYAGQLAMGDQPAYRQCKLVAVVEGRAVVVAPNRLKADFWNNERVQTMLRKELKRQFGEAVTGVHHIVNGDPLPEEIAA